MPFNVATNFLVATKYLVATSIVVRPAGFEPALTPLHCYRLEGGCGMGVLFCDRLPGLP